jgi:MGT family glycosyltransferase
MTTLARSVRTRGHEVVFISLPDAERSIQAAGLAFLPCGEKEYPAGSLQEWLLHLSKLQGEEALRTTMTNVARRTQAMLNSLPRILAEAAVDAVIIDTVLFYVELAPMSLGLPYLHVANALHLDFSGYTPPCLYDWPHQTTATALARNREGVNQFLKKLAPTVEVAKAYAEGAHLKVDWENPDATLSKRAWISQTPRVFDFDSSHWPPQFHHTAPFHDGAGRAPIEFPWDRLTGEPLIYASMGTMMNSIADVYRAIVAAAAKQEGFQLVLSVGSQINAEQIGALPANAIVVKRAPQLELLKHASVCITHAGLNTVLESLTQGVPQVAIPINVDQPGVAARIAEKETGLFVPFKELTEFRLSLLLDEVLTESTYRDNARRLQKMIVEANGLSVATDLIEETLEKSEAKIGLEVLA